MNRLKELQPVFMTTLPETLELGKIYISMEHKIAKLLCPCGSGTVSVLPFNNGKDWSMTEKDGKVTFRASVLEPNCPNRCHYFITDNKLAYV